MGSFKTEIRAMVFNLTLRDYGRICPLKRFLDQANGFVEMMQNSE